MNKNEIPSTLEPEMDNYQKQLVDSCFEEGQYIAGIKALEQLRSPNHRPAGYHIRQLLYIALHPAKKSPAIQVPGSPSKLEKRRLRTLMSISLEASLAAQRTLFAFAQTNSLEAIFNALPSLSRTEDATGSIEDSPLAIEALCISRCKSCWNLLSPGLIQPTAEQFHVKRYPSSDSEEDDLEPVVADHAWPVLKWLIFLFEHDEARMERKGLPRHSPCLLEQIPAPKGERNLRWEVEAPLDIVFSCLKAPESHQLLGARLFMLIINLSSTTFFDFHAFVIGVYKRVTAQSDILDDFLTLLSRLSCTLAVLRFKVTFLQKCLAPTAISSRTSRPKPQARAPAKQKRYEEPPSTNRGASVPSQRITSKPVLPSFADISKALGNPPPKTVRSMNNTVSFELLASYGTLQSQIAVPERDSEWMELESDDRWEALLDTVFKDRDNADSYRSILTTLRTTW
ncbi:hypothetical protein E1B28_012373 [Marasmius oreades]|uniref:Uncharacterized protein n=1 Tax=Marasmius oreades TaxID=181124 RepID=A0A9P7UNW1_9AGAR|nr:uncharacterized protein E1B28_012373 [Marasmius oreades]KAG7088370.1 hypothetical protein E1B28_012373 [Marasmius oreades]